MRLEISQFGGMAPIVDPTALAEGLSTYAKNVRFDRGTLSPDMFELRPSSRYPDAQLQGTSIRAVASPGSGDTRFAFTAPDAATAFPSPVAPADADGRIYYQTTNGARFTTNKQYSDGALNVNPASFRLGVPGPTVAPIITNVWMSEYPRGGEEGDEPAEDEPDVVDVAYCYTFVDHFGHESAPSPPSGTAQIAYNRNNSVYMDTPSALPPNVDFSSGGHAVIRLYRATFDGTSSVWQYINQYPVSAVELRDYTPLGNEAEELVTEGWLPPEDGMRGLCVVGASFAAGFYGHYVCMSEMRLPHAWPAELQYPTRYRPMALLPMANGLFIVTDGRPYWAEGFDPHSAIPREVPVNAPCISADSLVDMGGAAAFMSYEGIVRFADGRAELISEGFIDREQLVAMVDEDCRAFAFEGQYIFSTRDDRWMLFDPTTGFVELDVGTAPSAVASTSYDIRSGSYYLTLSDGRVRFLDHATGADEVVWRSKQWRTPPTSFSALRVEADQYPVSIKVRCQYLNQAWEEYGFFAVSGPHIERLPSMVGGLWEVEVRPPVGGQVYRVILAQSGQEAR